MAPIDRLFRSLRYGIPPGVRLGRRAGAGTGPIEFLPIDESLQADLDAISATHGSILYRGASAWNALGPGTNGQHLRTNGAGANPSWETPSSGGGGGWTYVNTYTASAAAQIDIPLPDATEVMLVVEELSPVTDTADLYARFTNDNFSTVLTTSIYKWFFRRHLVNGGVGTYGAGTGTPGDHAELSDSDGNATGEGKSGKIYFFDPQDTSKLRKYMFELANTGSDGNPNNTLGGCGVSTATAINGVRFYFSTGNIASATIHAYTLVTS